MHAGPLLPLLTLLPLSHLKRVEGYASISFCLVSSWCALKLGSGRVVRPTAPPLIRSTPYSVCSCLAVSFSLNCCWWIVISISHLMISSMSSERERILRRKATDDINVGLVSQFTFLARILHHCCGVNEENLVTPFFLSFCLYLLLKGVIRCPQFDMIV